MNFKLLTNLDVRNSHKTKLFQLMEDSDEIIFAVGFLKSTGLRNIKERLESFCKDKTKKSTFYIGGAGETDPKTLKSLHNILKRKPNHELIFCTPDAGMYHPKIYIFIKGDNATVVIGSANLSESGWVINDEVSAMFETNINSEEYLQLSAYFKSVRKKYYTDDIDALIQRYQEEFDAYQQEYGKTPFRFKRKRTSIAGIDMPRLKALYQGYLNDERFVVPEDREEQYRLAKANLEVLASTKNLSAEEFHRLFGPLVGHRGFIKLWHSGSLHRRTYETLSYVDAFRSLVRQVKSNIQLPVEEAFENSISFLNSLRNAKPKKIRGVGENVVAEILLSYDYEKFANLNENPVTVLEELGWEYKSPESFNGNDYKNYVQLLSRIREELDMKSFLEIDSFFNVVYWDLMEN